MYFVGIDISKFKHDCAITSCWNYNKHGCKTQYSPHSFSCHHKNFTSDILPGMNSEAS